MQTKSSNDAENAWDENNVTIIGYKLPIIEWLTAYMNLIPRLQVTESQAQGPGYVYSKGVPILIKILSIIWLGVTLGGGEYRAQLYRTNILPAHLPTLILV